jgi:FKBP-type peptidyl-prolyl cis-trans isomerase
MDLFMDAFEKTIKGQIEDLSIQPEQAYQVFQSCLTAIQQESAQNNKVEASKFLEENAKREGVSTTESGLQYEVLLAADGPKPKETDRVSVHYHGTLIDGTVFDSSVDRGEPAQFALNGVIPGWTEGIQLMSVGSKYKFYLPADLAYGDNGAGDVIQPGAMLIFEVELLEILK